MNETIETRIEQILALEGIGAKAFSQMLFGPNGLLNQLAISEGDRTAISRSPLFQRANERLTELQKLELAELQGTSHKQAGRANGVSAP